jgi:hypothetical protein
MFLKFSNPTKSTAGPKRIKFPSRVVIVQLQSRWILPELRQRSFGEGLILAEMRAWNTRLAKPFDSITGLTSFVTHFLLVRIAGFELLVRNPESPVHPVQIPRNEVLSTTTTTVLSFLCFCVQGTLTLLSWAALLRPSNARVRRQRKKHCRVTNGPTESWRRSGSPVPSTPKPG